MLTKFQVQKYPGRFLSGVPISSFGKKNYMALHLGDIMGLLANIILLLEFSNYNLIFF
nr:MAG TPA: hypothetical protein [Caudoviricetes sp.]